MNQGERVCVGGYVNVMLGLASRTYIRYKSYMHPLVTALWVVRGPSDSLSPVRLAYHPPPYRVLSELTHSPHTTHPHDDGRSN